MINKPTTLILGAGASVPFGFPTGYALLQKALSWANTKIGGTNPQILKWLGIEKAKLDLFREALSMSGKKSVDSFLEHRPEFLDIGKAVIALELIGCERGHELFKRDGTSWYEYLFNELSTDFDDFDKNKLSILTFNYDRSLEYYLLTSLHHSYGRPIAECAAKLKSIPIIHLHGDLGELPDLGSSQIRPYNDSITPESLKIATSRIKIIHEGIANEPQFSEAQKILSGSQHICFLGFGYHHLNINRLGFNNAKSYPRAKLWGSVKGFTYSERDNLTNDFFGRFPSKEMPHGCDVLDFLRRTDLLRFAR
jgi:hypothetical protein